MNAIRRATAALARLRILLGAPGLMIAGFSATSFAFGLFVLLREYDRPREVASRSTRTLLENWVRTPDYLGLTLFDYVDLWRRSPLTERENRLAALRNALGRLGEDLDEFARRVPMLHVLSLDLVTDAEERLGVWRSQNAGPSSFPPVRDRIAMTPAGESPGVSLRLSYRVAPTFAEGVNQLETAYLRVLLALLGLSGFSLLCLGYLILHTRALSDRVAREAAQDATLDLADRTCHELGNGVFVLANERRNLVEHLDLIERFLDEDRPAREAAALRSGLDPATFARWDHALRREYGRRGLDPDLELRASLAIARQVCRQIGTCSEYIGMTVRELDSFLRRSALPVEIGPVSVLECAEEATALLQPRSDASGVKVEISVEDGAALRALADRRLLIHALVNLLKNAIEAVGSVADSPRVTLTARAECRSVVLDVTDDGPGLDPETRAKLFAPGFSTKGVGRGRGLAIVRDSVHAQRGAIEVLDGPGRGATFRLTLPRA
ncbi:MAG: PAS domain-containing sensor histidine kinase [Isosphaeraceae bacterium]